MLGARASDSHSVDDMSALVAASYGVHVTVSSLFHSYVHGATYTRRRAPLALLTANRFVATAFDGDAEDDSDDDDDDDKLKDDDDDGDGGMLRRERRDDDNDDGELMMCRECVVWC